jgi:hypothetical protein
VTATATATATKKVKVTKTVTAPAPPPKTITVTAQPDSGGDGSSDAGASGVLLEQSGSGIKSTKTFTAPDGFTLEYQYDCSSFGSKGNFMVDVAQGSDDLDVAVNELGKSGSDSTEIYDGGSNLHLEINSECDWTVRAVG